MYEFINKWFLVIVISDCLSIVGSFYKILIDERVRKVITYCSSNKKIYSQLQGTVNLHYICVCITHCVTHTIHGISSDQVGSVIKVMHLSSAFPGRGTPGLPGGNQLKLKKSAPQYPGLSGLLGLFLARGLGTYRWLPLSPIVPLPF